MTRTSSFSERPRSDRPRRLSDWLNPTGERKVHSLVDKVYKRKNLELAWKRVKRNKGAGGIDGQTLEEFEEQLDAHLDRLHEELKNDDHRPLPVRQKLIPKAGQPGKFRPLGIPAIHDRVCQQALQNRLEPIFEKVFDDASFGYRPDSDEAGEQSRATGGGVRGGKGPDQGKRQANLTRAGRRVGQAWHRIARRTRSSATG